MFPVLPLFAVCWSKRWMWLKRFEIVSKWCFNLIEKCIKGEDVICGNVSMKGEIGVDDTFALLWTPCHVYIEACVANLICNNRMACKTEALIWFNFFFPRLFFTQIHSDLPSMMLLQFGDNWWGCKPFHLGITDGDANQKFPYFLNPASPSDAAQTSTARSPSCKWDAALGLGEALFFVTDISTAQF